MSVPYPLFAFEKDNASMRLVEKPDELFYHLEEIDIENDEYLFWDANGAGVRVRVDNRKNAAVEQAQTGKRLRDAFQAYAQSRGLVVDVEGAPMEVWHRIQEEIEKLPKGKTFLEKFFGPRAPRKP